VLAGGRVHILVYDPARIRAREHYARFRGALEEECPPVRAVLQVQACDGECRVGCSWLVVGLGRG
jgi:hypothetical protein